MEQKENKQQRKKRLKMRGEGNRVVKKSREYIRGKESRRKEGKKKGKKSIIERKNENRKE